MIAAISLVKTIRDGNADRRILGDIHLTVPSGQFVMITGESGSGKSTLLHLLGALDKPTSGTIALDGDEITAMTEDRLARVRGQKIGFVFQSCQLIPTLTAEENVALPIRLCGPRYVDVGRARELLDRVGLAHRLRSYPAQLSGGEQQRVAVARAFAVRPSIVMADEPTANLDSRNGARVHALLRELHREYGGTLLVVTHDWALISAADRLITLHDGIITGDQCRWA